MANTSIYNAFERLWQHVAVALAGKANTIHSHIIDDITELGDIINPENYAPAKHTHEISEISSLQDILDEKATIKYVDDMGESKANSNHNHDSVYCTPSQVDTKIQAYIDESILGGAW